MRYFDNSISSNPGSPVHVLYSPSVEKDGSVTLVETGKEDLDAFIQSHAESTDINVIISRIKAGETELLNKRPGSYGDFTKAPKTFAEALQLEINSNRLFAQLPVEVKQKFNNDPRMFFASAGNMEWYDKLDSILPDEVKSIIRPVDKAVEKADKSVEKEVAKNES